MVDEEHADAAACSILVTEKRETHAEHLGCVGHMHAVVCSGHTHTHWFCLDTPSLSV